MEVPFGEEIEKYYKEMYPLMFAYAKKQLASESLAEEAVHETFRIACQRPDAFSESLNPQGWLMVTLRNVICSTKREEWSAREVMWKYSSARLREAGETPFDVDVELLYGELAQTDDFGLLKEKVLGGKTHYEIAQELGISVSACQKRFQRAKENILKKLLK